MSQPVTSMHPVPVAHHPGHHAHHHDPESAAQAVAQDEADWRERRETLKARRTHFFAAGRILLSALFIASAVAKIVEFTAAQRAMGNFGLPESAYMLWLAIALELGGGTLLALGYKARRAAAALIAYLAAVTLFVHGDLRVGVNQAFALANLAFSGGLLMLVAHGAGTFSLDRVTERRAALRSRQLPE
jgi:putative oxidoreductase